MVRSTEPTHPTSVAPHPRSHALNAVTHGLTAKTHLPQILGPELFELHLQRFTAEWQPTTPTELHLVEELARHAVALQRATPIEEAILRTAARGLGILSHAQNDDAGGTDRVLAATCGTETVDRLTRYRRAHEKGFFLALARLRELRGGSACVAPATARVAVSLRFDEASCCQFLQARLAGGKSRCTSCGSAQGNWLAKRNVWQCQGCRRQFGLRSGTVMERSSVPLRSWFAAIAAILVDGNVSTAALCDATGIRRTKTVRAMVERIRGALASADADRRLAGLNRTILEQLAQGSC